MWEQQRRYSPTSQGEMLGRKQFSRPLISDIQLLPAMRKHFLCVCLSHFFSNILLWHLQQIHTTLPLIIINWNLSLTNSLKKSSGNLSLALLSALNDIRGIITANFLFDQKLKNGSWGLSSEWEMKLVVMCQCSLPQESVMDTHIISIPERLRRTITNLSQIWAQSGRYSKVLSQKSEWNNQKSWLITTLLALLLPLLSFLKNLWKRLIWAKKVYVCVVYGDPEKIMVFEWNI